MCQKIQFFFQEWDIETRESFIEALSQMTSDYIKSQQDYEREQRTKHKAERMVDLDVRTIGG